MPKFDRKRAFTLLEVVISLGIFTLLSALTFKAIITTRNIWIASSSRSNLVAQARNAINFISRELSMSNTGYVQRDGTEIVFRVPTDIDGYSGVFVKNSSEKIEWGADNTANYISYQLNNNNQLVREITDSAGNCVSSCTGQVLANRVSSLTFTNDVVNFDKTYLIHLGLQDPDAKFNIDSRIKFRN